VDQITIITGITAAIGAVVTIAATFFPASLPPWARVLLVIVASAGIPFLIYYLLVALSVGPFKTRDVAITDGTGSTGCTTTIKGTAKVPAGEDVWLLLVDNDAGTFYVQGPHGGPVLSGENDGPWQMPITVSNTYYDNASYSVIAIIVPYRDSIALEAQKDSTPLQPQEIPSSILASTRKTITLNSPVGCAAPAP
jgi:hypothetical protein